jgi:hypothetical protein
MSDPTPQAAPVPAPRAQTPLVQRLRLAVVGLFIVGLFVQVYLAGRGAFGASSYSAHKDFGAVLHLLTPVILVLTLVNPVTRNRTDVIHSVLLIVLFEVQFALADLKHPAVGAFHPVNALLLLGVAYSLFRRDLHALRALSTRPSASTG